MEESLKNTMREKTTARMIIRTSIHTFLKHYQYFTISALLAVPFSATILLSQSILPYLPLLYSIHGRVSALFEAAGFPQSAQLFGVLNLKLSQTLTSSLIILPFTLTFLLITKASVIRAFAYQKTPQKPEIFSLFSIFAPLFETQICNFFLILSANATSFALLLIAFNCLDGLGLSSPTWITFVSALSAVIYSIILANTLIITNLALILSGTEKNGGYLAILKACVLIRGRTATALSLALPLSLAMAGVEALFQYRIVRFFYEAKNPNSLIQLEGIFIAYLYSLLIVLDTIMSCYFLKSIRTEYVLDDEDSRYIYRIQIEADIKNSKISEELP